MLRRLRITMGSDGLIGPTEALMRAMADLWRLRPPGPDNLLTEPAFVRLREACRDGYSNAGKTGPAFALSTALRSLGLPCVLQKRAANLALPLADAVSRLDQALRARHSRRIHLAPLDLAEELPSFAFGPARIVKLGADELRSLIDGMRLKRTFPSMDFDADRFSEFHWLVVEELVSLDRELEARAIPVLFMNMSEDLGRIEPHKGRFPVTLEDALFFLLLAPWDSWAEMHEVDWRGFRLPWVYTVEEDLFVRPQSPPSPDSLSWEERFYDDGYGSTVEVLRPVGLRLSDNAQTELPMWGHDRWEIVEQARRSALFETPIAHFFVRAFLADDVDEVLAHMTTIEAALGLHADYDTNARVAPDRHKGMRATKRMRGRVAGLLGGRRFADEYEKLFNVRSAFLHGRTMNAISTNERVLARSLARQVVEALILAAKAGTVSSREAFLDGLLDQGATQE
jgi:hypothetical protein